MKLELHAARLLKKHQHSDVVHRAEGLARELGVPWGSVPVKGIERILASAVRFVKEKGNTCQR